MAANFTSLWGAPHAICDDGARVVESFWLYLNPQQTTRLSCGLYLMTDGRHVLRVYRNSFFYRQWIGDVETLKNEAAGNAHALEQLGWTPL